MTLVQRLKAGVGWVDYSGSARDPETERDVYEAAWLEARRLAHSQQAELQRVGEALLTTLDVVRTALGALSAVAHYSPRVRYVRGLLSRLTDAPR